MTRVKSRYTGIKVFVASGAAAGGALLSAYFWAADAPVAEPLNEQTGGLSSSSILSNADSVPRQQDATATGASSQATSVRPARVSRGS